MPLADIFIVIIGNSHHLGNCGTLLLSPAVLSFLEVIKVQRSFLLQEVLLQSIIFSLYITPHQFWTLKTHNNSDLKLAMALHCGGTPAPFALLFIAALSLFLR